MIFAVRTIVGREEIVAEAIAARAQKHNIPIKAVIHPEELKGYVFVEGDLKDVQEAVKNVVNVRGLMRTPVPLEELRKFLKPKEVKIELKPGDIVEVISGPFKDTKGKVTRFDEIKREVTIEPLETAVPIPITISVEFVKILKRADKNG
jgi:transcriptional antiterminator NusG